MILMCGFGCRTTTKVVKILANIPISNKSNGNQNFVANVILMNNEDALFYANQLGLPALDMGAAHSKPDGYLGVDQYENPNVDIVCDVTEGIPLPDSSVGAIRAYDFIEHIPDGVALFNEFYRVLAPGGLLLIQVPSSDGRGAYQDPTHVTFYNENSFWYYTDPFYQKFVPTITCRFEALSLQTVYPSEWHATHNISYVFADLKAIKQAPAKAFFQITEMA